ncbi:MAG: GTP-binding protein [Deltaproteobacteria bacterium]|nr:GTP-binding protein [Deltaproteobacteria bacterium]
MEKKIENRDELSQEKMNIVIVGHVDHGKSTVVGRLLADTGSLPEGKLEKIKADCERNAKPFEYAFLIDALKDEQSQGITIDSARVFFQSQQRRYILIDAPGHIEFLKNMVTGASRAEAAVLVIDAAEGIRENSRRHGYLLSLLGITKVVVAVNKMDLVGWRQEVFGAIEREYRAFLEQVRLRPAGFIPISGREGDNIAARSGQMGWYQGPPLLAALDAFHKEPPPVALPFRMPVQDVYKFTQMGDNRRIIAGTVAQGQIHPGDEVVFYPSGKRTRIKQMEVFSAPRPQAAQAGMASGFTMGEEIYVQRGEMATKAGEPRPKVAARLRVSLFWLGKEPMVMKKDYLVKLGTARSKARIEEIHRVLDASTLEGEIRDRIDRHAAAEVTLVLDKPLAFDLSHQGRETARFVVVDNYEITGGGIVLEDLPDRGGWVRESVIARNYRWEPSLIGPETRAEQYNQHAALVLITGRQHTGKKRLAKALEQRLFSTGKIVYYLGIGSVVHGLDADLKAHPPVANARAEHIRRLAEIAHILMDAGVILIVTAVELTREDLEVFRTVVNFEKTEVIWVGEESTDIPMDLVVPGGEFQEESLQESMGLLQEHGIIFKP